MYMPTTLPGLSIGKAQELLQQTDRLIASLPEVERVFGKIGRADTATDPAPLTMCRRRRESGSKQPTENWTVGESGVGVGVEQQTGSAGRSGRAAAVETGGDESKANQVSSWSRMR